MQMVVKESIFPTQTVLRQSKSTMERSRTSSAGNIKSKLSGEGIRALRAVLTLDRKQEEKLKEKDLEGYERIHDVEVQWMSQELYYLMAAGLEDNSTQLTMVQNLRKEERTRGPNAWRALVQEAVGMSGNRLLGLANQIHSPARVRSYAEVLGGSNAGHVRCKNMKKPPRPRCRMHQG